MVNAPAKLRIGARDRLILWHTYRHGVTCKEVVYRMFFDAEANKLEAARKPLRRLTDGGYLQYVADPWPYHRLASAGAHLLETLLCLPSEALRPATRPFKVVDALFERCVLLAFCCLGESRRTLLTPHEFNQWFGAWAVRDVRSWPFYLERDGDEAVLCYAIVDSGSSIDGQIKRVTRQLTRRLRIPGISELERLGRFRISVLTVAAQRAIELNRAFHDAQMPGVQIIEVPQASITAPGVHGLK